MNNPKVLLLLAILLIAGGGLLFLPGDEKKIRNNLASFAEYCSSIKEEPVIETLQKAAQAAKLCTDPCKVQIESFKINREFSQKEISDRILIMKKRLPNTKFSFHDTVVNIPSDDSGEVLTTIRLNGETAGGRFTDAYEINITAEKKDGAWLFSSFTVVEFIEK